MAPDPARAALVQHFVSDLVCSCSSRKHGGARLPQRQQSQMEHSHQNPLGYRSTLKVGDQVQSTAPQTLLGQLISQGQGRSPALCMPATVLYIPSSTVVGVHGPTQQLRQLPGAVRYSHKLMT